ncbi:MAG: peptide ABC transporter substrate-binding protein [Candidatus Latescibacteria bacterium]|nr:peptide ABC transporter substrate-binding protein [Candidatus Latescibacterota bacterium]
MSPEPRSLDSSINDYDTESTIIPFDPLLRRDEHWVPGPGAADSFESSEDGKIWTFQLRPGAKWSDGRPVTAHDFVYSYRRMIDPEEANPYGGFYYDIKNAQAINRGDIADLSELGIRAVDDLTLVIETEKAAPYLPYIVSFGNAFPVPKWQVEKYDRKWTLLENIVSNSGFKLGEWVNGSYMTFVPDPNYNGPHKPYLEKVIHPFREASTATILPYENNEVDIEIVDITDLDRIEKDPDLSRDLVKVAARGSWYLFFKTKQPPFDDIRVREALARAINREAICRIILRGTAVPGYSMIPPEFGEYSGDDLKSLQNFEPDTGKRLMREAGFPNGRGFPRQEMWLRAPSPTINLVGQAITNMLKENLGIDITIRSADRTMYMNDLYNWRMNLGFIVFYADYLDPRNMLDMIWHSQAKGYSRSDWSNTDFDRLVEEAAAELDMGRRGQLYRQAERIMVEDYAGAFLYHPVNLELRKPWIRGYSTNPSGISGSIDYTQIYVSNEP